MTVQMANDEYDKAVLKMQAECENMGFHWHYSDWFWFAGQALAMLYTIRRQRDVTVEEWLSKMGESDRLAEIIKEWVDV